MKRTPITPIMMLLFCSIPLFAQTEKSSKLSSLSIPVDRQEIAIAKPGLASHQRGILRGLPQLRAEAGDEKVDPSKFQTLFEGLYENAFLGAKQLEEIVLPKNTKQIRDYAFTNCDALKSIKLPEAIDETFPSTFPDQEGLVIYVPSEAIKAKLESKYNFEKTKFELYKPEAVEIIQETSLSIACDGTQIQVSTSDPAISAFAIYSMDGALLVQGSLSCTQSVALALPTKGTYILITNTAMAQLFTL